MRGRGLRADISDPRDFTMESVFSAPRHSGSVDLESLVRTVRDQGQTSACVGCAVSTALDVRQQVLDLRLTEPSPLALYAAARSSDSGGAPLRDDGCRSVVALKVARDMGVPRELDWPFNRPINAKPSWGVWSKASACRVAMFGRSIVDPNKRADEVDAALEKGFPVLVGFDTDETFENLQASDILGAPESPTFGGHMVVVLKKLNPMGMGRMYRVLNSWGEGFCDGGFFNANELWLRAALEVRVCEVSP